MCQLILLFIVIEDVRNLSFQLVITQYIAIFTACVCVYIRVLEDTCSSMDKYNNNSQCLNFIYFLLYVRYFVTLQFLSGETTHDISHSSMYDMVILFTRRIYFISPLDLDKDFIVLYSGLLRKNKTKNSRVATPLNG